MSNAYVNAAKRLRVGRDPETGRFKKNPIAKGILLFLADGATEGGFWYFGDISTIADVLEYGESTVRKHIDYLVRYEFITKKKLGKKNGYQMNFKPFQPKTPLPSSDDNLNNSNSLLPSSGEDSNSLLPSSTMEESHRYVGEFSPLPNSTATTELHNQYLKGIETPNETFLKHTHLEVCETFDDFYKKAAVLVCAVMKVFSLPNEDRWKKKMRWAFENKFTPEDFAECYRQRLNLPGRIHPVTPEQVADSLPYLRATSNPVQDEKPEEIMTNFEIFDDSEIPEPSDAENEIWFNILSLIEARLDPGIFKSWFCPLRLVAIKNHKISLISTRFNHQWIEKQYSNIWAEATGNYTIDWIISDANREAA